MKFLKKQELRCILLKIAERLKKDKKLTIIVFVSILLMIGLLLSEVMKEPEADENEPKVISQSYEKDIEDRLSELIALIDGAGETKVMITLKNGEESVYARNSGMEIQEGDSERTKSEQEYVIIKNGSEETGLHLKTVYPEISGVAVVCRGAESAYVKQRIISTVTAVLGISSAKVSVVKMKTEGN